MVAIELLSLRLSSTLAVPLPWADIVLWSAAWIAGAAACWWSTSALDAAVLSRRALAIASAAGLGTAVVWAMAGLAQILPNAQRIGWVMHGDAVGAINFARIMLTGNGIGELSAGQSTPLPFGLIAANAAAGRGDLGSETLLRHDVLAMAGVWILLISICCLLAGVIVARATRNLPTWAAIVVTGAASLASLSWYVIGFQLQFGFVNTAFALALLLCGWLAFEIGSEQVWVGFVALVLCAVAMLGSWSPLVVCLGALALVLLSLASRDRTAWTARHLAAPVIASIVFLVYAGAVALPQYLALSSMLAAEEGGFPKHRPGVDDLVIAGLAAVLAATTAGLGHRNLAIGTGTLLLSFAIVTAFLMFQRRDAEAIWGYSPAKFAWTVSLALLVIAIALAVRLLSASAPGRGRLLTAIAAGLLFLGLYWSPVEPLTPLEQAVPLALLAGEGPGLDNTSADAVFKLSGRSDGHHLMWRNAPGDRGINFWLLQVGVPADSPVRAFAHSLSELTPEQVCTIIDELGDSLTVHTSDPSVRAVLAETCGSDGYRVVFEGD